MLIGRPLLLAQCVDRDLRLYYAAVQNLVYGCENVPQTTAKSSDTPPMSILLPAGLRSYPIQMAEVVQQEYVLVDGAWL